ncbi:vWA domain-containing protein [Thalassoglobus sp. JC818]|uniref:vWA domain-containing protein n=1 Tax=Thalassoglobus sp. JC818 TaxID=3232136 RepID=UPI003459E426
MISKNIPALLISLIVHFAVLGAMGFYRFQIIKDLDVVAVETIIEDERLQQEFEQDVSVDTQVSESLSVQSGGTISTNIGAAAAQPAAQTKIEQSEALKDPDIKVTAISDISLPGLGEIAVDLGEGEVSGEVGARVEGYGAAMHRLTQEIIRMMREQPVIAVWMFDASNSLQDDRKEIRENFHKIYDELNIAKNQAESRKVRYSPLETMVCSFGSDIRKLTQKPTSEIEEIKKAIDRVEDDPSGIENPFSAISRVLDEYGKTALNSDRKLMIIVVTDESGTDDQILEEVISKSETIRSPVYFLGREAVFGHPKARVRWKDPEPPNLTHWVSIDRGPETAFPECLQYTGFGDRWDSQSSGFGPYGQVRLAKKSGGIFFMLSGEEQDLAGRLAWTDRKFDDLAMKEYEPLLLARRDYEQSRKSSEFRDTLWQVIVMLNPNLDKQLNIKRWGYSIEPAEFDAQGKEQFDKTLRAMSRVSAALKEVERIAPMRAEEREPRWRAAYDLLYAQLMSYRVRQFQFLLALDQHSRLRPKLKDPKSNEWYFEHTQKLLEPDEEQIRRTKVDMTELNSQREQALALYDVVIKEHPGTPWAVRASAEKRWGFGITFEERFWDPRYYDEAYRNKRIPKF